MVNLEETKEQEKMKKVLSQTDHRRHSVIPQNDSEAADAADSPWDICNILQLQHWATTNPEEFFKMLELVRTERDTCLEVTAMAQEWGKNKDAAQAERDGLEEEIGKLEKDVDILRKNEDDLTSRLKDAKETIRKLRQEKVASALNDDADAPVTERPRKHEKSTKIPDPPVFTNGGDPSWDDWYSKMVDKLAVNSDHYPTEPAKIAYVIGRLGGDAAKHTVHRRLRNCPNPYTESDEILRQLSQIYEDPHRVTNANREYKALVMGREPFIEFFSNMTRHAPTLGMSDEQLLRDLPEKLRPGLLEKFKAHDEFPDLESAKKYLLLQDVHQRADYRKGEVEKLTMAHKSAPVAKKTTRTTVSTSRTAGVLQTPAIKTEGPMEKGGCYNCGEPGHHAKDCKNPPKKGKKDSLEANIAAIEFDSNYLGPTGDDDSESSGDSSDSGNE